MGGTLSRDEFPGGGGISLAFIYSDSMNCSACTVGGRHNAYNQKPFSRHERQEAANTSLQTIMAGNYAETTARGKGLLHCFVSHYLYLQQVSADAINQESECTIKSASLLSSICLHAILSRPFLEPSAFCSVGVLFAEGVLWANIIVEECIEFWSLQYHTPDS